MFLSRLKSPKNICLLLILYNLITVLLFWLSILTDEKLIPITFHLCPGTMLFIFLYIIVFSSGMLSLHLTALVLLGLTVPPLIGWYLMPKAKWKGEKWIRIPVKILLIANCASFIMLFIAGLAILYYGKTVYLNIVIGIAVPLLLLYMLKQWNKN